MRVRRIYSIRVVGRGRNKLNLRRAIPIQVINSVNIVRFPVITRLLEIIKKMRVVIARVRRIYIKGVSKKTPILLHLQHFTRIIVRGMGGVRIVGGRSMRVRNTIRVLPLGTHSIRNILRTTRGLRGLHQVRLRLNGWKLSIRARKL